MGDHRHIAPPKRKFEIRYVQDKGYTVFDDRGARVSGFNASYDRAQDMLKAKQAAADAAARRIERPCMCCGRAFKSEGIHNRLCNACRGRSGDDIGQRPYIERRAR